jgi:hypothetical protein
MRARAFARTGGESGSAGRRSRRRLAAAMAGLGLAAFGVAGSAEAATSGKTVREPRPVHAAAPPASQKISSPGVAASRSTVTMVSESGDWVGGGTSRVWRTPRDTITTGGSKSLLGVSVSGASGSFTLDFAAPDGRKLEPGFYGGAQRYPFEEAGMPGLDVSGDGRGCNEVSGRFWVLDLSPDRSRVWVVYEEHCEGGQPAVFGEIRIGERRPGGPVVAPTRVQWPDAYPDVSKRPVPVHVVNPLSSSLTVSAASIVAGDSDFSVLSNDCGTLAPGDDCTVYVGWTPTIRGPRVGELRLTTSAGTRWVPLTGSGITGKTFWTMHSQPGDWVGGGNDFDWTPQNGAQLGIGGSETHAWASVTAGNDWYYADFEAAPGSLLLPGTTFDNATRYPFNAGAGLAIYGDGAGCNEDAGSFTVQDSAFTDSGQLKRLLLDFTQYCDGSSAALTGTISWNEPDPNAPPRDASAPHRATGLGATATASGRITVGWTNPGDADWADTVVRILPGRTAPQSPVDGREVYTGRGGHATVKVSRTHHHYAVACFTRDTSGNWSRRVLTVMLPG